MISVVIPSFNRRQDLLLLLADLSRQEGVELEVILVDDNSSDDTVQAVGTQFPRVVLLRNATNQGPTISRNRGVRMARGHIIVGLDSDVTIADPNLLARVRDTFARLPAKRALAFRVLEPDGKSDDAPRWWHPVPIESFAGKPFETDYFSGTAYAFRKSELIDAGLFPEALFQYYEEVQLAYRFMDLGGVLVYAPDLAVLHHPGIRRGWSDHRFFHNPRSQILFAIECFPPVRGLMFLIPRIARGAFAAFAKRRGSLYCKGVLSALRSVHLSLRRRKPIQKPTWRRIARLHQGIQTPHMTVDSPVLKPEINAAIGRPGMANRTQNSLRSGICAVDRVELLDSNNQ